jgi:hypothetical protein
MMQCPVESAVSVICCTHGDECIDGCLLGCCAIHCDKNLSEKSTRLHGSTVRRTAMFSDSRYFK